MIYRLAYEPFVLREPSTTCGMSHINHRTQKPLQLRERVYLKRWRRLGVAKLACNFVFPTRIVGNGEEASFPYPLAVFSI